jgi:hypothetical protein
MCRHRSVISAVEFVQFLRMTQATKINWKDDSKNLTKLYPLRVDEDDGETLADPGSFFNFFEVERDYNDVSLLRLYQN